ncbi:hypothetical protein NC651_025569 [Populus alba x Populus x berolinensis]|nr:hypothetical protein NC651_025569 [Populus alba x Populus x berolinensis]
MPVSLSFRDIMSLGSKSPSPTLSLAAILWKSLDMHRRSRFLPTRDKAIDAHLSFLFHAYSFGLSDSMAVTTSFMPV